MKKFNDWINTYGAEPDFFFIQVGANDGASNGGKDPDPLHAFITKYDMSGLLIEPVPYIFETLKKNYSAQKNLYFENAAIAAKSGKQTIYRLKENNDELPWFYEKLATFHKDVLLKHEVYIPNIEKYIVEEIINCISFTDLLKKYGVNKIDLLMVDTEGHDYQVLRALNFSKVRPRAIFLEHFHLKENELQKCKELLHNHGYKIHFSRRDLFAY